MKTKAFIPLTIIFFVVISFGGGYALGQSPVAPIDFYADSASVTPNELETTFVPFWEVWDLIHTRYYDQPVDNDLLTEGAIDGMLAVLDDPHTRYMSAEDEAAARDSMAGEIEGIGATVENVDGNIVIVAPLDGSPAEAVGLKPGDILRQADGVDLNGMDVGEAAGLVRGPKGTTVNLLIERDGEQFEQAVVRDVVQIDTVRGEIMADNVAYVRLSRFGDRTAEELETVLEELLAQEPVGLVLDLRSNPGGGLQTAVDVADQFLPDGVVLVESFGDGRETVFESTDKGLAEDIPIVVLLDEGSASASEVLAGAIQDRERGVLIGQTSFGKGTVQTWQTLSNGGGVRITIARWLTPDEDWVHGEGLEPDYAVELPEIDPDADVQSDIEFEDTQLQAAIDYLLGRSISDSEQ